MYRKVRQYDGDTTELAERITLLRPVPTLPLLYTTTEPNQTEDIYRPLLGAFFPGAWIKCFLAIVWPNGSIMAHRDEDAAGRSRCHLVIKTNPECWCIHDGAAQQLDLGGVYVMDATRVHAAANWGADIRAHLVIDRTGE